MVMRKSAHHKTTKSWLQRHRGLLFSLVVITLLFSFLQIGMFAWANDLLARFDSQQAAKRQAITDQTKMSVARREAEMAAKKLYQSKKTAATVIKVNEVEAQDIDASSCNVSTTHIDPSLIDVMVNKKHCVQPLTYAPSDLVVVHGATLSAKASDSFRQLFEAAAAAGQPITVTSSYRSYSEQVSTYQYWVGISGADGADTYSARPGYSEHQTGFVIDIASADGCSLSCFGTTSQYSWMQAHAAKYGFVQRYYAGFESITGYTAEEWHYRYVGTEVASDMKYRGIKTLEEYWNLPGGTY